MRKLQEGEQNRLQDGARQEGALLQKVRRGDLNFNGKKNKGNYKKMVRKKVQSGEKSEYRAKAKKFLEKAVINVGVGRLSNTPNFEEKTLVQIARDLGNLAGQKPQIRKAKKSIAGFKIREGQIIGLRVTLRGDKAVDFFERLIKIVLPRVRDFTGLGQEIIDSGGVLNIGIKEQFIFPEISHEGSPVSFSLGISVVPRDKDRVKAVKELLEFGVPLKVKK